MPVSVWLRVSKLTASRVISSQILKRRFLPFLFLKPSSLLPQLCSTLKTPKDLEHANLFSITSLKFLLVCTLHIPLHKELHWYKFLSAGTTTSCLHIYTFTAHTTAINKTFCKTSLVISESPFNTQAVYFPYSSLSQTMKSKP